MVPVFRVHRDLRRGTDRDLVAGQIFLDVDESQGPTVRLRAIIRERSRCLHLTCRNRIQDKTDLAFEHPAGHRIKGNLGLVTGIDPLKGILLERSSECLVPLIRIDENHDRTQRRRDYVRSRAQRDLGNESCRRRPCYGLIEIILGKNPT